MRATVGAVGSLRPGGDEFELLASFRARLAGSARPGEVHSGDDAAVLLTPGERLLFATDVAVEGVHFDLSLTSAADAGFKVLVANVSDIAAMGGRPTHAVAGVAGPARRLLEDVFEGMAEACSVYETALVGGDLSAAPQLYLSVAILGEAPSDGPVLRSGARAGDLLYCTGPLGGSAAGLRQLRADRASQSDCAVAYARPSARVREGALASSLGASAMIDISDGLAQDLAHLAAESGVGIELDRVPVADGASEAEALGGGEDYELAFATPPGLEVEEAFSQAGLPTPVRIGEVVGDEAVFSLRGEPLEVRGYAHDLGGEGL